MGELPVSKPATPSGRPGIGGSGSPAPSIARAADAGCDLPDAGIARLGAAEAPPSLAELLRSGVGKSDLVWAPADAGGRLDPVALPADAAAEGFEPARSRLAAVGLSAPMPFVAPVLG